MKVKVKLWVYVEAARGPNVHLRPIFPFEEELIHCSHHHCDLPSLINMPKI